MALKGDVSWISWNGEGFQSSLDRFHENSPIDAYNFTDHPSSNGPYSPSSSLSRDHGLFRTSASLPDLNGTRASPSKMIQSSTKPEPYFSPLSASHETSINGPSPKIDRNHHQHHQHTPSHNGRDVLGLSSNSFSSMDFSFDTLPKLNARETSEISGTQSNVSSDVHDLASTETVLEILIGLVTSSFDVSATKAGQLLTTRVDIFRRLLANGVDDSMTKVHNFFHDVEQRGNDLAMAIIQEQRDQGSLSHVNKGYGSVMTVIKILCAGLVSNNGTTVMWAATALTSFRSAFNNPTLHVSEHLLEGLWQWFVKDSDGLDTSGGIALAVAAIFKTPKAAPALTDFISTFCEGHMMTIFAERLPFYLDAEVPYLQVVYTYFYYAATVSVTKKCLAREGVLQYVIRYTTYVIAHTADDRSKCLASSLLAFIWHTFCTYIPGASSTGAHISSHSTRNNHAKKTGWVDVEEFVAIEKYTSHKPEKNSLGSKDILAALKRCCRHPHPISVRIDVMANLFNLISNFCKSGYVNQANMIFKSLVFTTAENVFPTDGRSDIVVEFLYQNVRLLLLEETKLEARELSVLFGSQTNALTSTTPEFYLLMSSFISHQNLRQEDVENFIYFIFRKCISDEENHFLATDILVQACKRVSKSVRMPEILKTTLDEGCVCMLQTLTRGGIPRKLFVQQKEHLEFKKTYSYGKRATKHRAREHRKSKQRPQASFDDGVETREKSVGYGNKGTMTLHTMRELVHVVPADCLTKKLLTSLKSYAAREIEMIGSIVAMRQPGHAIMRAPKLRYSIRVLIEDIRSRLSEFVMKPGEEGADSIDGVSSHNKYTLKTNTRKQKGKVHRNSNETPAHVLAGYRGSSSRKKYSLSPLGSGSPEKTSPLSVSSDRSSARRHMPSPSPTSSVGSPYPGISPKNLSVRFNKASSEDSIPEKVDTNVQMTATTEVQDFELVKKRPSPKSSPSVLSVSDQKATYEKINVPQQLKRPLPNSPLNTRNKRILKYLFHKLTAPAKEMHFRRTTQYAQTHNPSFDDIKKSNEKKHVYFAEWLQCLNTLGLCPQSLYKFQASNIFNKCCFRDQSGKKAMSLNSFAAAFQLVAMSSSACKAGAWPDEKFDLLMDYIRPHTVGLLPLSLWDDDRSDLKLKRLGESRFICDGIVDYIFAKTIVMLGVQDSSELSVCMKLKEDRRLRALVRKREVASAHKDERGMPIIGTVSPELTPGGKSELRTKREKRRQDAALSAERKNLKHLQKLENGSAFGSTYSRDFSRTRNRSRSPPSKRLDKAVVPKSAPKEITSRIQPGVPKHKQLKRSDRLQKEEEEKKKLRKKRNADFKAKSEKTKLKLETLKREKRRELEHTEVQKAAREELASSLRIEREKTIKMQKLEKERQLQAYINQKRLKKSEELEERKKALAIRQKRNAEFARLQREREQKLNPPKNITLKQKKKEPRGKKQPEKNTTLVGLPEKSSKMSVIKKKSTGERSGFLASVRKFFAKDDVNNDGLLDIDELLVIFKSRFGAKLRRSQVKHLIFSVDTDGDGKLTEAEYDSLLNDLGEKPGADKTKIGMRAILELTPDMK